MLSVKVQFENNLYTKMLLETRDNPCLCKIYENFEIIFFESIPEMTGIVNEWNIKDIDERVPAGVGGKYIHYKHGLITISHQTDDLYIIESLKMFVRGEGWINVIENKEYVDLIEEEEPDWLKNL